MPYPGGSKRRGMLLPMRRTRSGLSRDPFQRAVQLYIAAFLGWLVVGLLVIAVPLIAEAARTDPGSSGHASVGHDGLRSGLGVVAVVISLALPVITWVFRDAVSHVRTVRGTYASAAVVTLLAPVPGLLVWQRVGLIASAVGLVSLVLAIALPRTAPERQVDPSDWRGVATGRAEDPEHWITRATFLDHPVRNVVLLLCLIGGGIAALFGVFVLVT